MTPDTHDGGVDEAAIIENLMKKIVGSETYNKYMSDFYRELIIYGEASRLFDPEAIANEIVNELEDK